jgi:hypothetical protein
VGLNRIPSSTADASPASAIFGTSAPNIDAEPVAVMAVEVGDAG